MRYYHAGLSKKERENLENWFLKSKDGVIFATSAYGTGIDKSNIRTVIHHSLPSSVEEYLQESGRGGRDFKECDAYAIVNENDKERDNILAKVFTGTECRRKLLLAELGQEKDDCSGCDVCSGNVITEPPENKIIISALKRHPLKYTSDKLASILTAEPNIYYVSKAERLNPYYGLLKGIDKNLVKNSINLLTKSLYIPGMGSMVFLKTEYFGRTKRKATEKP